MTTAKSPIKTLKAQAATVATTLKKAAAESKHERPSVKFGIVMDDKLITIEMEWSLIRATTEVALAEYVLNQMREARDVHH